MYPHQEERGKDILELVQEGGHLLVVDEVVREDPEAPLTEAERDAVVDRTGWQRTGPWVIIGDDAEAPVENLL